MGTSTYKHNITTEKIYNHILGTLDGNHYGASAMMATLRHLSNLNPRFLSKEGMSVSETGLGLGAWTGKKKRQVCEAATKAGKANSNLDIQLGFLDGELYDKKSLRENLMNANSMDKAVIAALRWYEKISANKNPDIYKERLNAAKYYLKLYGIDLFNKSADDDAITKSETPICEELMNNLPYVEVTADKTKLRSEPKSTAPAIVLALKGERYIYGKSNDKGTWYQVFMGQSTLWISAKACKII